MTPVALLHGFLGQPEAWDDVAAALRERAPRVPVEALRLPGHGRDAAVPPRSWDAAVDALAAMLPGGRSVVAGYSNGARLALGLLARHPARIAGLVLVSSHLGLRDPAARVARAEEDERLAALAEHEGLGALVAAHRSRPVLAGQTWLPATVRSALDARRRDHRAAAVAGALRAHGLGAMPDLRGALAAASGLPLVTLAGGDDPAYVELAREAAALGAGKVVVVPGVGHDVVLEAPRPVVDALVEMLARVDGRGREDRPAAEEQRW